MQNTANALADIEVVYQGQVSYETCFEAMKAYTQQRDEHTPDQLWVVEHPAVYTLGLGADPANILNPHQIPIVQTDRGGEVTFHGPGQVVIYILMDLKRHRANARIFAKEFVHRIEQAVIDTLANYQLSGVRKEGAPGIYVAQGPYAGAKIAALGLKIKSNGCTYHGVSLNVNMDLTPFTWINPCGYVGLQTIDMTTLGVTVPLATVQTQLAQNLIQQLNGSNHDN